MTQTQDINEIGVIALIYCTIKVVLSITFITMVKLVGKHSKGSSNFYSQH